MNPIKVIDSHSVLLLFNYQWCSWSNGTLTYICFILVTLKKFWSC